VTTLVIDRRTLPESISSLFQTPRVKVQQREGGGKATITPVIDADDYADDDDYVDSIPGLRAEIFAGMTAPDSEFMDAPDDWINRNV